jgi:hypothetical protein
MIAQMTEPPLDAPHEDWLVWADAMQEIGDPRGELIALGHPLAFVKAHAERLLGRTLGRHVRKGDIVVTRWRHCYADEIELRVTDDREGPQLVVDALGAPCAQTLRGIGIAGVTSSTGPVVSLGRTLGWLRESTLPPSLVALALVDDRAREVDHLVSRHRAPGPNLVEFGPLHEVWRAFAQIERLTMVVADPGQVQFARIQLPKLRSFTLDTLCWVQGLGDLLARAQWPMLRTLELRCCDGWLDNQPSDARAYRTVYTHDRVPGAVGGTRFETPWELELQPLFEALAKHSLERLALTSFDDGAGILAALRHVSCAVEELALDDSAFDTHHVERLLQLPMMAALQRLSLERVKLATARGLRGRGLDVVHSCRPTAPTYRYVVGME